MKNNLTELIFIMDRSGSMAGLEGDTIGGFNSMLQKQKEEEGELRVTSVLFDDKYEMPHYRVDAKDVRPLTAKEYFVRGSTALLDAVGKTILTFRQDKKAAAEEEQDGKVLFVITTDGLENASKEFTYDNVRKLIEEQQEKHGWKFLFLGANIDAAAEAAKVGIDARYSASFVADGAGMQKNFAGVCMAAGALRRDQEISTLWKEEIEEYLHQKEGGKGRKGTK